MFVDVDMPFTTTSLFGVPLMIPDLTQMEINATGIDGSATATWVLPNEVLAAMAMPIEEAEADATPEVTQEGLPGFDED